MQQQHNHDPPPPPFRFADGRPAPVSGGAVHCRSSTPRFPLPYRQSYLFNISSKLTFALTGPQGSKHKARHGEQASHAPRRPKPRWQPRHTSEWRQKCVYLQQQCRPPRRNLFLRRKPVYICSPQNILYSSTRESQAWAGQRGDKHKPQLDLELLALDPASDEGKISRINRAQLYLSQDKH